MLDLVLVCVKWCFHEILDLCVMAAMINGGKAKLLECVHFSSAST